MGPYKKAIFVVLQAVVIAIAVHTTFRLANADDLLFMIAGLWAAFSLGTLFCDCDELY